VHESTLEQEWRKEGKVWKIFAARHKFGDAMPDIITLDDV
jgi:hypothetical protein